jgi:hypothetical protein
MAAGVARLDRRPEALRPPSADEALELGGIGRERSDLDAVAPLGQRPDLMRLLKEAAGVEGDEIDGKARGRDSVGQHLILDAEARREDGRPRAQLEQARETFDKAGKGGDFASYIRGILGSVRRRHQQRSLASNFVGSFDLRNEEFFSTAARLRKRHPKRAFLSNRGRSGPEKPRQRREGE